MKTGIYIVVIIVGLITGAIIYFQNEKAPLKEHDAEFVEMEVKSKIFEAKADSMQNEIIYACSLSSAYRELSEKQANASVRKYLERKTDSLTFKIMLMASDRDFMYSLSRFVKP